MAEEPQVPEDAMAQHRRALGRGFNWLGGATIIAKVTDFSTTLVVLLFLSKQQVGIGSLVVSIGMVVEAFDGLGTGDALVQAESVTRRQLDSLFWFILGAAGLVAALTLAAAPAVQAIYGVPGMAAYFVAVAAKQPLVGAAVIPLARLNRALRYERIAAVNVGATFGAALARAGIALAGGGAWALAGGYAASGVFILAGALMVSPFRPRLRFNMAEIAPLLHFGLRSSSANIFEQIFKNIDFLLVGWFYGAAPLAVYRVAFDVAMEPAMAIGTIINRTALPVFARAAVVPEHLTGALLWSLQRLTALNAPLMAGILLLATPLTALLHDSQGHSYGGAALPMQILALAAILRITSQLLTPVLLATGEPGRAARLSAATLALLGTGILAAGLSFPARTGIIAVSAVWLAVYPALLCWGMLYLYQHWRIRPGALARPFLAPGLGIAIMLLGAETARHFAAPYGPEVQIGIALAATLLTYGGLSLHARKTHHATVTVESGR
jgi:O-antigen/teichoic acid export membrane protein